LPHNVDPEYLGLQTYTVTTRIISLQDFGEAKPVPIWILLLAVMAGLLFLAVLSFCLWHFGFFTRVRPQDAAAAAANGTSAHVPNGISSSDVVDCPAQEGVVLLQKSNPKIAQTSFVTTAATRSSAGNGTIRKTENGTRSENKKFLFTQNHQRSAALVESNGGSFVSSGSSSAYQSMPGNSASMLAVRNSARISQQHFGTVSNCHSGRSTSVSTTNTSDYQSLLPYPNGLLQPGDEVL